MPNTNKPFGLKAVGLMQGAPSNFMLRKYLVPATDATAIYVGDPVKLAGSAGQLNPDDTFYPTVTKSGIGDVVVGVVVGVQPIPTNLNLNYRAASTAMYVYVNVDPDTIYEIQADSNASWAVADVGLNCPIVLSTGSTATGVSNAVANRTGIAATNTLDLAIVGLSPAPDNETGAFTRLLVRLNKHQYVNGATGL